MVSLFEGGGSVMRVPRASEQIADRLRGQIVRGEFAEGEMLPSESRMVEDLGVSRPTLREAFRILENDGLITVLTGARGGPRVRLPDLAVASRHIGLFLQTQGTTLADLLEARTEFGAVCARLLATRGTQKTIESLDGCIQSQREVWEAGISTGARFAQWVSLTGDFHDLVALHCGNKTLAAQIMALAEVIGAERAVSIRVKSGSGASADVSYIPRMIADYAELVRLVEARDARGAETHWRDHLERAAEIVYRNRDRDSVLSLFE
ncbi:FadR/GntR family transcriptional regulator [Gordonia sp. DT218]|uniref:FadR/GntR family transcriptional regulator n=1 Tax=Gordonia sp. DT218 TaxID=3416659 RepID=UPI003CE73153